MPFPLLPLVGSLLPSLVGSIFGDNAEGVTKTVTDAAISIFGSGEPNDIEAAIAKDPSKALEFKAKLLDIQDREAQRRHDQRIKEIEDTSSARTAHAGNKGVFWLGLAIIMGFSLVSGMAVYFAFNLLFGGASLAGKDPGLVAAVFTFIGTVIGGLSAMAMQATGFFFGSSSGQETNAKAMAEAFMRIGVR